MKYIEKVRLTKKEIGQANKLIASVHKNDGTYTDPYLNNQYNYFADMPTFVLAYQADELVGLVMLYADGSPKEQVDIHVVVAPNVRNQGVARAMIARAKKILVQYGYSNFCYASEQSFLDHNPDFLANLELTIDDREYNMRSVEPTPIAADDPLRRVLDVCLLRAADVEDVAALHSQAFGDSLDTSRKYIAQSLQDKGALSFVLCYQEKIIGYCAIDTGSYDYFFGLFIIPSMRKRGFASFFIKKMMEMRQAEGTREFVLDVETDNLAAFYAYKNAGFKTRCQPVYLVKKASNK